MVAGCRLRAVLALLALAACSGSDPGAHPVLPDGYRQTFVEVRGCRRSVEHDLGQVIVRVPPELQARYDSGPFPFPEGALIVKEEYEDASCTQPSGWTLMKKEAPGYDPARGDWRWYRLNARQQALEEGKLPRCSSCHQGCQARDYACGD